MSSNPRVDYQTSPSQYKHLKLAFDGAIATLSIDIAEDGGIRPGYKLKLNSYDLGVDIELYDALNRIRFEHPEVRTVVVTSARDRIFCSGANIFMLGLSSHAWKVNFCKFTNETRNGIEDSSKYSGLKFVAALNGACAGGGYELALACDDIVLVDDRSSSVSLPEVPLLGVLPGTGGLTRVTDKRHVRHDLADIFCTTSEGVRGQRAVDWRLVDAIAKPQQFQQVVRERAEKFAAQSDRPADGKGVILTPLARTLDADRVAYEHVTVDIDRARRAATFTVKAPTGAQPADIAAIEAAGVAWWPLQMARELDDAILHMRTNELEMGTWVLKASGRRRRRAGVGRRTAGEQGPLAGARDPRPAAPHAGASGCVLAQPVRADRRRFRLCRHAGRAGLLRRPRLHAGPAGRPGKGAEADLERDELRLLPDGQRPVAPAAPLL
jgi:benzoyl-CoA-dihydrodiol lyase